MPAKLKSPEPIVTAYAHFYESDLAEIKRRAEKRGYRWSAYLREAVHDMLRESKKNEKKSIF